MVRGVADRLGQVFRNLIDNAVTFSPADSTIEVRLSHVAGGVAISVDDQGPGLPPGKAKAIFDRFYSERPADEKFGTHSGLGLSISKQIIEAHGGHIHAGNRSEGGAHFEAWLPI
ncbi:MAG: ATP-binding protein, partial [Alphaproteobacteria bacterium]|nr:ATP-binding protein [Alphaproteobacteria bacterium]